MLDGEQVLTICERQKGLLFSVSTSGSLACRNDHDNPGQTEPRLWKKFSWKMRRCASPRGGGTAAHAQLVSFRKSVTVWMSPMGMRETSTGSRTFLGSSTLNFLLRVPVAYVALWPFLNLSYFFTPLRNESSISLRWKTRSFDCVATEVKAWLLKLWTRLGMAENEYGINTFKLMKMNGFDMASVKNRGALKLGSEYSPTLRILKRRFPLRSCPVR